MPLQFRKRIRLLPGIWLNVGKSGVSTSIGGPGATVNVSRRGTRTTLGVPGTGLSYTTLHRSDPGALPSTPPRRSSGAARWLAILLWVFLIGTLARAMG